MFLMDSIKHSLKKVMYFPHVFNAKPMIPFFLCMYFCTIVFDGEFFSFLFVCIFSQLFSTVSCSMDGIEAKDFVIVVSRIRV